MDNNIYLDFFKKYNFNPSRMISSSKSFYRGQHEYNLISFNGNIFLKEKDTFIKVWWGDIDISLEGDILKKISNDIGKTLYVVSEMEGRFGNENNQNILEVAIWDTTQETPYVTQDMFDEFERKKEIKLQEQIKKNKENTIELKKTSDSLPLTKPKEIFGKKIINHLDFSIKELDDFYNNLLLETQKDAQEYVSKNMSYDSSMNWDLSFLFSNEFIDYILRQKLNLDFDKDTLNPSSFVVGEETNSLFIKYNDKFESIIFNEERNTLKDALYHPYTYGSFLATCFYDYTNKKGFSNSSFFPNRIYILEDYLR